MGDRDEMLDDALPGAAEAPPLSIREAVIRQVERGELDFDDHEGSSWVTARLGAGNADVTLAIDVSEEREMLWLFGVVRGRIPADRRGAIAELLARINYETGGLTFDMNFADGEFRIRGFLDGLEPSTTGSRLDRMITVLAAKVEQWYPAIMSVAFGDADPAGAFEREMIAEAAG